MIGARERAPFGRGLLENLDKGLARGERERHHVDDVVVQVELQPATTAGSSDALKTSARIS